MEGLTYYWYRFREKLARWGILAVLWVTHTYLTHDGGYELLVKEWGTQVEEDE